MILTEKMEYLSAIILHRDADIVTKALLDLGVVDFSVTAQTPDNLHMTKYSSGNQHSKMQELAKRCENFLDMVDLPLPRMDHIDVTSELPSLDVQGAENFINELAISINQFREQQRQNQRRISELQIMQKRLVNEEQAQSLMGYTGTLSKVYATSLKRKLEGYIAVTIEVDHIDKVEMQLLFNQQDNAEIRKIAGRYRLENIEEIDLTQDTVVKRFSEEIEKCVTVAKEEQSKGEQQVHENILLHQEKLASYWVALRAHELYGEIQSQFTGTRTTVVFSGWIPSSTKTSVIEAIYKATHHRAIIKSDTASLDSDDKTTQAMESPPTKLKNNVFSRPYELLVNTYGVVKYGQVDPTLMVSIFFTIMFGMMFGDFGQGLVILGLGIWLLFKSRRASKNQHILRDAGRIVMYCGLSAMVFGVLFGSYFGLQLIPPVWFDLHGIAMTGVPHYNTESSIRSIGAIFALSFQFGFVVLGTGILFNFINKIRSRSYFSLIFSESGILGALFYIAITHMVWHYVSYGNLDTYTYREIVMTTVIVIMLLFAIVPIKHTLEENKKNHQTLKLAQVLSWPAIWLFELFEMTSRYFSSTLSFVRVGAIGIVHAVLMGVFYSMAANTSNIILSILIIVFVNVLVIGLEGLLAAVNSMRLHFYEFFSRYFVSGGRLYKPVTLKS
ncbi:V-type ATPase 116kDa subunit family protein [Entomospira entomophila]|uniref:V-type ATP synthase subunit I n=1 Tax=Entomospira entomophila TaxID=2719988 RepID=A0A968G9F5_9SPIO|nr:V-type ATPase 116kDa subunit family protein [Entomospira entomophilus]NIZ40431.1 hypothetical protein [Entomospira entomophilus]WDI35989.1 V-type ATPase 116kDa subunit family protein [Entomospira entomophilus]